MAMPIGSMIEKFRPEFESYLEQRQLASDAALAAQGAQAAQSEQLLTEAGGAPRGATA
jgi:hypothetical protein